MPELAFSDSENDFATSIDRHVCQLTPSISRGPSCQISAPKTSRARSRRTAPLCVSAPKLGLRPDEAAAVVGSESVFRDMRAAGWVTPIYHSNNVTLFDYADVARAFGRLRGGERPQT